MYRVMVVDDHPIVRDGLVGIINIHENLEVIACASDGIEALKVIRGLKDNLPDVILLDMLMPRMNGVEFIDKFNSSSKVIVLSTEIDRYTVMNMLSLGINGYLRA